MSTKIDSEGGIVAGNTPYDVVQSLWDSVLGKFRQVC